MKKVTIEVPDDLEFNPDKFDYELVKKEKKELCYADICRELFENETYYYICDNGHIENTNNSSHLIDPNNCTSEKQAKKLLAINKLMNVAKFLNKGWKPDWRNTLQEKWYFISGNTISVLLTYCNNTSLVYFRTSELAERAIKILGEETIRLALSTDW